MCFSYVRHQIPTLDANLKVSFCRSVCKITRELRRPSYRKHVQSARRVPFRAANSNSDQNDQHDSERDMPVSRQQIIIRVFRKYSHSLGPEELEYLDEILKEHDISDEDVEMSIELIAKEYNKQDGSSLVSHLAAWGAHAHFSSDRCYHEGLG